MHAKPARTCTRTGEPVHSNTHGWAQQRVQRRRRAGKCGAATQPCALLLRGLAERKVQERQEPREGRGRAPDCTGAGGDSRMLNAWLDTEGPRAAATGSLAASAARRGMPRRAPAA